ncbi:L,D-transpeptidase family protein [Oerskovia sp. NPDC060338]|uniref:L,D-transpeptidase family protein n=1 Tax=Oerskovia sp. NPDC060338 TaxID=3347100 RepID=UPI003669A4AE
MSKERSTRTRWTAATAALVALLLVGGCDVLSPGDGGTSAPPASTSSPSPSETPTPTPTPTPSETPAPAPETPAPVEPAPPVETPAPPAAEPAPVTPAPDPATEELVRGSTGERVVALQQRLADLGYLGASPDGIYGPGTQQAVWALQKAAGISRDGRVGPQTQAALDQGVRPTPQSSSGHVIEIDIARQLVLAVDDGRVTAIINASSGNGERYEAKGRTYYARTPAGTFQVGRQVDGSYESSLELGSMWRPKFFNGGIAVHGSASVPPSPASHGCVRVSNGAMNWIWDSWGAPAGTTVIVY